MATKPTNKGLGRGFASLMGMNDFDVVPTNDENKSQDGVVLMSLAVQLQYDHNQSKAKV